MRKIRALLTVLVCALVIVACCPCPEPPDGEGGHGGDPNPPTECEGPGEVPAGERCETDCDCCGLACAVFTAADGSTSKVCAAPCQAPVTP